MFKILKSFLTTKNKEIEKFLIEFEFFDSNFKHVLVEYYNPTLQKFIPLGLIVSKQTFKWKKHCIYFKSLLNYSNFLELVIKISLPNIFSIDPFIIKNFKLKVMSTISDNFNLYDLSDWNLNLSCLTMGFYGPYKFLYNNVLSIGGKNLRNSAYIIFNNFVINLNNLGFININLSKQYSILDQIFNLNKIADSSSDFLQNNLVSCNFIDESKKHNNITNTSSNNKNVVIDNNFCSSIKVTSNIEDISCYDNEMNKSETKQNQSQLLRCNFLNKNLNYDDLNQFAPSFLKNLLKLSDSIVNGEYELNKFYFNLSNLQEKYNKLKNFQYLNKDAVYNSFESFLLSNSWNLEFNEFSFLELIQSLKLNETFYLALAYKLTKDDKYLNVLNSYLKQLDDNLSNSLYDHLINITLSHRLISLVLTYEFLVNEISKNIISLNNLTTYVKTNIISLYNNCINKNRNDSIKIDSNDVISYLNLYSLMLHTNIYSNDDIILILKTIKEIIKNQFNDEGCHVSQALVYNLNIFKAMVYAFFASYKANTCDQSLNLEILLFKDDEFIKLIKKICKFLGNVADLNGLIPKFGNYYDYFTLPFDLPNSSYNINSYIKILATLLNDNSLFYKYIENNEAPELLLLFNKEKYLEYKTLFLNKNLVNIEDYNNFEKSGYLTFKNYDIDSNSNNYVSLILKTNYINLKENYKLFEDFLHDDFQSFILNYNGINFIDDSGSNFFIKNNKIKEYLKCDFAHNTILLNKRNVKYNNISIKTYKNNMIKLVSITSNSIQNNLNIIIRRTFILYKTYYLIIIDDIFNLKKKTAFFDIDLLFHLPLEVFVELSKLVPNKDIYIYNSRTSDCKIINLTYSSNSKINKNILCGSYDPVCGWNSNTLGEVNCSQTIINSIKFIKLPLRVYNLFYFLPNSEKLFEVVKKLHFGINKSNNTLEVIHNNFKDVIKVNEKFEVEIQSVKL